MKERKKVCPCVISKERWFFTLFCVILVEELLPTGLCCFQVIVSLTKSLHSNSVTLGNLPHNELILVLDRLNNVFVQIVLTVIELK